jgi:hypothetical protein
VKSVAIANIDASPSVLNTKGFGGAARLHSVGSTTTGTSGVTAGSIYQLVRIRSNAVIKHLRIKLDNVVTVFMGDVGFYYSTGASDGTLAQNSGTAVNGAAGSQLFGAAIDFSNQTTSIDLTDNLPGATMNLELWQACGLTSDPGGFFDVVITTVATNNGVPVVYTEAQYTA